MQILGRELPGVGICILEEKKEGHGKNQTIPGVKHGTHCRLNGCDPKMYMLKPNPNTMVVGGGRLRGDR